MRKRPRLGKLFTRFPNLTETQRRELCRRRIRKSLKTRHLTVFIHLDRYDANWAFGYAFSKDISKKEHSWNFQIRDGKIHLTCKDCGEELKFNLGGSLINYLPHQRQK